VTIPDINNGSAEIGGTPIRLVSLLGPDATERNSPAIIRGIVRERTILANPLTGAPLDLLALIAQSGNATTQIVTLTTDYTLTAADAQKVFVNGAGGPITVTIPEMASPPAVIFMPKVGASITVHPGTTNVFIDGASADQVRSVVTDPSGFGFTPVYGTANTFATTTGTVQFSTLAGPYTDNASIVAGLATKVDVPSAANKLGGNLNLSSSNAGDGMPAFQNSFIFINASGTDRTVTFASGIRTDINILFARGPSGVGNLVFATSGPVTLFQKGVGTTLATAGCQARLVGTGIANTFFLLANDLT
jgi:hypothetical protein